MTNKSNNQKNKVTSIHPNHNKQGGVKKKKSSKKKFRDVIINSVITICCVLGLGCIFQIIKTNASTGKVEDQIVSAQDLLKSEQQAVSSLQNQANLLKNDDYVAKLARSRYYLSKEDEIIFSVPEDNDSKQAEILNEIYLEQQAESNSDQARSSS